MKKKSKMQEIRDVYKKLGLRKADYPAYSGPMDYEAQRRRCSLLKHHEIRQSDSTIIDVQGGDIRA